MKKSITATLLSIFLVTSCVPSVAFAQTYTDVNQNHWAYESVAKADQYGIMKGMGDGTFGMGKPLKRAEFASLLVRMMGWETNTSTASSFEDNSDTGKWYYNAIETLLSHNAVKIGNGQFRPEENITREEIAVMLISALGYSSLAEGTSNATLSFKDVTNNKGYISMAYDFGIISGKSSESFEPNGIALREEAAAMMIRAYDKLNSRAEWKHGFYAFSSWSQKDMAKEMNAVSFGWSKLEYRNGEVVLNTTSENNNEWKVPSGYEEAVSLLEKNGVEINLNVYMSNADDGAPCEAILTNSSAREKAIQEIINELTIQYKAAGKSFYDGVTIDFENLKGSEMKNGFTAFLKELKIELDKINKTLYVAVQPRLKNSKESFDGYDFKEINKVADKVILMAHDYAPTIINDFVMSIGFTTTPVTPFDEVYYALKTTSESIDKNKLVLALSIDTAGWNVENKIVTNSRAIKLTPSEIYQKLNEPNTIKNYSEKYRNPYITYPDGKGTTTLWYEDSKSIEDKIKLAKMFGINSLSVWRIGTIPNYHSSDLNVWNTVDKS